MADDGVGLYPHFTTQFSANLEMLLQQQTSELRSHVSSGTHVGKQASPVNHIGPVKMQTPQGRFAPKTRTDSSLSRRWVFPIDKDLDQLIDSFDELKTIVDPKSMWVQNASAAAGREFDDILIAAATATAYIGQDAASLTSESFDTTNHRIADTFGSSAASGLTVAKIRETRRILRKAHVLDSESACMIIGSQQESDLLGQVQVVSTEFNDRPVLVDGRVKRFLGFDIVVMERLGIYTTNTRGVLAFVRSGLHLGIWKDMTNSISKRTNLSGEPFGLYTMMSLGATRTQAGKVIQIGCLDTTGVDVTP